MERRHSQRAPVSLNAEIIAEGEIYPGLIDNISAEGMEYLVTSYVRASKGFAADKRVEIRFDTPGGEKVSVHCDIRWCMGSAADERVLIVGMKIINPSSRYRKLIRDIYNNNSQSEQG